MERLGGFQDTESLAASCGLGKITVYINAYMTGRLKGRERERQTTLEREGLTKPAESRGCKRDQLELVRILLL